MSDTAQQLVCLSLGSNLGVRVLNLEVAIQCLRALGSLAARSSLYETEPLEIADQPWFLNCAVTLETAWRPEHFLERILAVERDMGRRRTQPKGPRVIDIDILLFGSCVVDTPALTVPHPAMHLRRFVLEPLAEIAPQALHPILGKTVQDLLRVLPPGGGVVKRIPASRSERNESQP